MSRIGGSFVKKRAQATLTDSGQLVLLLAYVSTFLVETQVEIRLTHII